LRRELRYRHGGTVGYKWSSLYGIWVSIKQRCLNPKNPSYKNYGGRGITLSPEWIDDFMPFRDYVNQALGPRSSLSHTIDRIENAEGYWPGNLKWSTPTEQRHNARNSRLNKIVDALIRECLDKSVSRKARPAR
jgi:hypothetical protein